MNLSLHPASSFYRIHKEAVFSIRIFEHPKKKMILNIIYKRGECTQKYISDALNYDFDLIGTLLKQLQRRKLIISKYEGCYSINKPEFLRLQKLYKEITIPV